MLKFALATAVIGVLGFTYPITARAADAVIELHPLGSRGPAPRAGFLFLYDMPHGVLIEAEVKGLTPGETAFRLVKSYSCTDVAIATEIRLLGTADVDVNEEDGAENLSVSFTVPDITIDEMSSQSLVIGPLAKSDGDALRVGVCGTFE